MAQTVDMSEYSAVVLAGGAGSRLGGVDKAAIVIDGRTLLAHALDAVAGASRRIVVGPAQPDLPPDVTIVREEPTGGGPVAAVDAGLQEVASDVVVVLACDMPLVTSYVVDALVGTLQNALACTPASGAVDGVLLRDEERRRQPLAAAYRTAPLRRAVAGLPTPGGAAMRQLLEELQLRELRAPGAIALDCDTWESVAACRHAMERRVRLDLP
jgi:molybdopterin-guanine dinucleotide biosynthesis protein A